MAISKQERLKKHTPDGIPWYRVFNGVRYLLIGGRFRKKENAIKFAKQSSTHYLKGGLSEVYNAKARVVKNPNGKSWLVYRTPEPKDRIGTARIPF